MNIDKCPKCGYRHSVDSCLKHAAPEGAEGAVMVPLEPTSDMLYAMATADGYVKGDRDHPTLTRWQDYWRLAIAARPLATAPEGVSEHQIDTYLRVKDEEWRKPGVTSREAVKRGLDAALQGKQQAEGSAQPVGAGLTDYPSLYDRTGDIKDINTLLVPRASLSAAAPAPEGWMPIESAPKDGTHVLAALPDSDTCHVICWVDAEKGIRGYLGPEVGWHMAYDGDFLEPHDEPEHWMPLPAAPVSVDGKEGQ